MGYRSEIYAKALEIKKNKVKERLISYEAKVSALREQNSEFLSLENEMGSIGASLAIAAISGDSQTLEKLKTLCDKASAKKNEILKANKIEKPEAVCKICNDENYLSGKLCSCVECIAKQLTFEELSASLPINDCSFDNFDLKYYSSEPDENGNIPRKRATALLKLCREFADNFPFVSSSLLFMGAAGLGKTHLSLSIVSAVAEKGYGVVYGSAYNLLSAAEKEHFSYNGDNEKEEALLNCDLLVIDDLGTEFLTSYTSALIYNIINTRILNGKPTIINTNLSFDELENRYTARITSRFLGSYEMKKFIGSDIRQIKAIK